MHIAIDTTPLHSAHQMRGIGSYTRSLVDALKKYEAKNTYTFFVRGETIPKNADIVHIPYFDPFFLTLPILKSKPTVVTVHDLIPLAYPKAFPAGRRGTLKWHVQRLALAGAAGVITDSQASRADIERLAHIPPEKIHVVPLAADEQYKKVTDIKTLRGVEEYYHLPESFVLYVGDINWNKNIPGLLSGFARYQKLGKAKFVLAGKAFLDLHIPEAQEIDFLIRDLHLDDAVIRTGFVDIKDLPAVYSLARVYIQPSFAEGFGLPILEAMASGTPVIASRRSSLVEIAGPSCVIDPDKPDTIGAGIETLVSMKAVEYQKLSDASIRWAREFTWKKTAHQTILVYEEILAHV